MVQAPGTWLIYVTTQQWDCCQHLLVFIVATVCINVNATHHIPRTKWWKMSSFRYLTKVHTVITHLPLWRKLIRNVELSGLLTKNCNKFHPQTFTLLFYWDSFSRLKICPCPVVITQPNCVCHMHTYVCYSVWWQAPWLMDLKAEDNVMCCLVKESPSAAC